MSNIGAVNQAPGAINQPPAPTTLIGHKPNPWFNVLAAVVIVAGSLQGRSGATDLIRVLQLDSPGDFHARISA